MRIFRDPGPIPDDARGAACAIGNFDGVHLGHRAVIDLACEAARERGAAAGVLTFEPHPREFFAPDAPPFRLMNRGAKAHRLEKLGVETLFEMPFDATLAALPPEAFVADILAARLGLSEVVVGEDFLFGHERAGDAETLGRLGAEHGIGVTVAPLLDLGRGRISSTAIRRALSEGRPRVAAEMLGHWHRLEGLVAEGDKRGRDLGFPTANMTLDGLHLPRFGVYAVRADVLDGPHAGSYDGAASIGVRPTFGINRPNCETYLFDFSGDLYGATLSVALVEFLRPEERFDGVAPLIAQMEADCVRAREVLADV